MEASESLPNLPCTEEFGLGCVPDSLLGLKRGGIRADPSDMSNLTNAVCFTCGLAIESPPRLNRLTSGQVCPACRERVLDGLPPALPSSPSGVPEASHLGQRARDPADLDDGETDRGPGGWGSAS